MNRRLARVLARLYPRAWRERYGAEFEEFLETGSGGLRASADIVWSALWEHIFPTRGGTMDRHPSSFGTVVRQPSAFLPMAMSLAALTDVLIHLTMFGAARQPDEGTAAHIWQLLMAGQMPILLFFAIKWLPRAPKQTLYVLGLQVGAVLASLAPVYFLNW